MTLEALSVLGEEYIAYVEEAFAERWIDVVANAGKRSGAYSGGAYDTAPYIAELPIMHQPFFIYAGSCKSAESAGKYAINRVNSIWERNTKNTRSIC